MEDYDYDYGYYDYGYYDYAMNDYGYCSSTMTLGSAATDVSNDFGGAAATAA